MSKTGIENCGYFRTNRVAAHADTERARESDKPQLKKLDIAFSDRHGLELALRNQAFIATDLVAAVVLGVVKRLVGAHHDLVRAALDAERREADAHRLRLQAWEGVRFDGAAESLEQPLGAL